MKHSIIKSYLLALTLAFMPMSMMHAMDHNESRNNTQNQSIVQRISNYFDINIQDIDLRSAGLYAAGLLAAQYSHFGTAMHEAGHAAMATAIKPGSVKDIVIFGPQPHIKLHHFDDFSFNEQMAIFAAGPIAGALGCYAGAKSLQLFFAYQKTKNLRKAFEETCNTPILSPISTSPFITGFQHGLASDIYNTGLRQMRLINTGQSISDGLHFLRAARNVPPQYAVYNPSHFPYWNITIDLIQTGIDKIMKDPASIHNYLEELKKYICILSMDEKNIIISPSILMGILLTGHQDSDINQSLMARIKEYLSPTVIQ